MSVNSKMTAIADAIRAKTGGTELLTLDDMAVEIAGISGGGIETVDVTIVNNTPSSRTFGYLTDSTEDYATITVMQSTAVTIPVIRRGIILSRDVSVGGVVIVGTDSSVVKTFYVGSYPVMSILGSTTITLTYNAGDV